MGLTQERAIEICKEIHNNFYSYENTIFTKSTEKMSVTCPLHGVFTITYSNHTHSGKARGCPECGKESRRLKKTLPISNFLEKAKKVHGDTYNYSLVAYTNTDTKVEILCKEHGSFWQTPEKHKLGRGCPSCAGKGSMTALRFRDSATRKHGTKYEYSLISDDSFSREDGKVPIICKEHGIFLQKSDNHLHGQGCRKCARYGFNVGKSGLLYVLSDNNRVKVGITNRHVETRLKEINKPNGNFKVVSTYEYTDGFQCAKHETELLKFMRKLYKNTDGDFDGVSESFEDVNVYKVIDYIEALQKETKETFIYE